MKLINFVFPLIYQENEAKEHIQTVLDALRDLYEVYLLAYNSSI
jgi:hypothetical protein